MFQVRGKIVVYNQPFIGYSATVQYRRLGAREAALMGAVAALIRSLTSYSLDTPHTGIQVSHNPAYLLVNRISWCT